MLEFASIPPKKLFHSSLVTLLKSQCDLKPIFSNWGTWPPLAMWDAAALTNSGPSSQEAKLTLCTFGVVIPLKNLTQSSAFGLKKVAVVS